MIAPRLGILAPVIFVVGMIAWPQGSAQTAAIVPQGGNVQTPMRLCPVHDFTGKCGTASSDPNCEPLVQDGSGVTVGLIRGPSGDDNFYGTTPGGGTHNWGTIFKISPTGVTKVLYSFGDGGPEDGRSPSGGLTLGPDGSFYGTTYAGGHFNVGIIYRLPPGGDKPALLYTFHGGDRDPTPKGQAPPPPLTESELDDISSGYPVSPPVFASDKNIYGVTPTVDPWGEGVLYRLSPDGTMKCLHRFRVADKATYGLYPETLTLGRDGKFYGTTWQGGLNWGTIFQFDIASASGASGGVTTLYKFNNAGQHCAPNQPAGVIPDCDGSQPNGVIQGADGNLYGTMRTGGPTERGVVFRVGLEGQSPPYKVLHAFNGNVSNPTAGVVELDQNGSLPFTTTSPFLYGASELNNSVVSRGPTGILFRVRTDGSDFSAVYNFDVASGAAPGVTPVLASDSNLYGIAEGGGKFNAGEFYRLNTAYFVTGQSGDNQKPNSNSACVRPKLIFQGNQDGKSYIYDNGAIQVVTHMAASRSDIALPENAAANDGITVRVRDATAKIVQFFYRQRFGAQNIPIEGWSEQYDPAITYAKSQAAVYGDWWWASLQDGNEEHTPPDPLLTCRLMKPCSNQYWTSLASRDLSSYVNGCTDSTPGPNCYLLSEASKTRWYVDAQGRVENDPCQPSNDPIYLWKDTAVDCDGVTLFDSPNFVQNATNETQIFKAIDFIIVNSKVTSTVTWTVTQIGSAPLQYAAPQFGGPPSPVTLNQFRAILVEQKFGTPF
jgi:uncharacterized repeat protein (TIGR03803 family)